jgi:hypothetical protein
LSYDLVIYFLAILYYVKKLNKWLGFMCVNRAQDSKFYKYFSGF